MSTSYDLFCLDCEEWSRIEDSNGYEIREGDDLEKFLVFHRPSFESIGMALKDTWRWDVAANPLVHVIQFFGRHAGHALEVRDEYGRSWATIVAERTAREAAKVESLPTAQPAK